MNPEFNVIITDWETGKADSVKIRRAVFIIEQNVPEEIELDDMDSVCIHAVAYDQQGNPVGTGRLADDGKVGRMAVLKEYRNKGAGRAIMNKLLEAGREKGITDFYLNSQTDAVKFYEKFGFESEGSIFKEAGIDHVHMVLSKS